jgi:HEAT repeat protein
VRRNAVLSLARIGRDAEGAEPALVSALTDESRYVRADAAHALRRIGTPEANDTLLEFLTVARWCPDTSPRSTH